MYLVKKRFSDKIYAVGVICVSFSFALFCLSLLLDQTEDHAFGMFCFSFAITWFYMIYRWAVRKSAAKESILHHQFLFLILSLISAYSLNRSISVFENSANWFSAILILVCLNYAAVAYLNYFPVWAKHLVSFVNGIGMAVFIYLTAYLIPMFAMGLIGFFLLGLSLHVFVPLFISIYTIVLQGRITRKENTYWISFAAGLGVSISVVVIFLLQWSHASKEINKAWRENRSGQAGLPAWVAVSQKAPATSIAKKALIGNFLYTTPDLSKNFFWREPGMNFGQHTHDPLVMMASLFVDKIELDDDSRVKVLESVFDLHHETQERLWGGDHLTTSFVNTAIKVWPACNMAYTEKTITISNKSLGKWDWPEEAIYTFYMPEGSVVTSLSLWINGKEEKGLLTTKALAAQAYQTIVGKERRDPSVVHWQEGNTVSVRVFPVTKGEQRMFKIGITSPMERINGKLRYENIRFKGPSPSSAEEEILMDFEQPVHDFEMPASFISKANQSYKSSGKYTPSWHLELKDPGLAGCTFSFNGNSYTLSPYHEKLMPAKFSGIYLDINQSWTKNEFDAIIDAAKEKNVFVYDSGVIKISQLNRDFLWRKLGQQRFSVFPLFAIEDVAHSLLVTKSAPSSLQLDDLYGTDFMGKTKKFLEQNEKINVFDLGDELSLYLRSFKEYRVFRYDKGNTDILLHRLQKEQFPEDLENDNKVVIHKTDMVIEKKSGSTAVSGPDHVMRLFSYNHIMQKLGKGLFLDRTVEDSLVQEAREAYIVSPVSSLVVLETQADYDRFNIKNGLNSLQNASLQSKGAAPEPHEWVLIVLVSGVLFFTMKKRRVQYSA